VQIQLSGYDLERHTPLNKRSDSWKCILEQKPSTEVKRAACKAQRQDCINTQVWGRLQNKSAALKFQKSM